MVYVVKVGGKVVDRNLHGVLESVSREARRSQIVLVHGGGNAVTEYCRRVGVEPKFVVSPEGIRSRYTDKDELEVFIMVMAGKLNKEMVSGLIARGVKAVGISGVDGPTLIAERKKRIVVVDERGRKRVIDGGYTGSIIGVNTKFIEWLLSSGYTIVMTPVAIDGEGNMLNVDADQVACKVATSIKADKLMILTDVPGVLLSDEVIGNVKVSEIEDILPKVGAGMNRKLMEAVNALAGGVKEVVISSGLAEDPLKRALDGKGTVLTP
ncbi:MAG: [LysW]-aminoadipate/[LysW]-glutamate kinase [Zestosphaera sp.]